MARICPRYARRQEALARADHLPHMHDRGAVHRGRRDAMTRQARLGEFDDVLVAVGERLVDQHHIISVDRGDLGGGAAAGAIAGIEAAAGLPGMTQQQPRGSNP